MREWNGAAMGWRAASIRLCGQGQPCGARLLRGYVYRFVKRVLDLAMALCGLVVFSPVFLIAALLIKKEDNGPVFYKAQRMGQHGKLFCMFKFRSMRPNTATPEDALAPDELVRYYKEYKLEHDPRVTNIGAFLRKSSIDELPQLINILRGDMSIVGPRPIVSAELEENYTCPQRAVLLSVKPGLTGAWQVYGRSNCTYDSGVRQKVELLYVESRSLKTDAWIILKTIPTILSKIGAR